MRKICLAAFTACMLSFSVSAQTRTEPSFIKWSYPDSSASLYFSSVPVHLNQRADKSVKNGLWVLGAYVRGIFTKRYLLVDCVKHEYALVPYGHPSDAVFATMVKEAKWLPSSGDQIMYQFDDAVCLTKEDIQDYQQSH